MAVFVLTLDQQFFQYLEIYFDFSLDMSESIDEQIASLKCLFVLAIQVWHLEGGPLNRENLVQEVYFLLVLHHRIELKLLGFHRETMTLLSEIH